MTGRVTCRLGDGKIRKTKKKKKSPRSAEDLTSESGRRFNVTAERADLQVDGCMVELQTGAGPDALWLILT